MRIQPTRSVAPELAARYIAEGWWAANDLLTGIERVAAHAPDRLAVVDRWGQATYGELAAAVERMQHRLHSLGIGPGDVVGIVMPNWLQSIVLYHAALRRGAVVAPMSTRISVADLRSMATASRVSLLACPPGFDLTEGAEALVADGTIRSVLRLDPTGNYDGVVTSQAPNISVDVHAPAVVIFTSGSTAASKGVVHSLATLGAANRSLTLRAGLDENDVHFVVSPIAHITGVMQGLHMPFDQGSTVVLSDRWDPLDAAQQIEAFGVTFTGGAPVHLEGLMRVFSEWGRKSPLRVAVSGGAPMSPALIAQAREILGARVMRVYGSTEFPFISGTLHDDDDDVSAISDGMVTPGTEVRASESGELLARGPALSLGYLDSQDTQDATMDGWLRTGDLAEINSGRLRIIGRQKEIAIRYGEKVSLAEVEKALVGWDGCLEHGVYVVPDEQTGERVGVAVRSTSGAQLTLAGMHSHLAGAGLATRKFPEEITEWREPLPRTDSGKLARTALAQGAEDRVLERALRLRTVRPLT